MRDEVKEVLGRLQFCVGGCIAGGVGKGKVELVDINEGKVTVKLIGGCGACPGPCNVTQFATKMSIEKILRREIPEVKNVNAIFLTV